MTTCRGVVLAFAALMLIASEAAVSQTNATDTFVKGTTDFLLDRANDNYIYVFQKKLEANPQLQNYLPETLRMAKAGDLQSLIMHKDLWQSALKRDLVGDGDKLFTKALNQSTHYIETLCVAEMKKASSDAAAEALVKPCTVALDEVDKLLKRWQEEVSKVATKKEATDKTEADKPAAKKDGPDDPEKQIEAARKTISDAKDRKPAVQQQAADSPAASGGQNAERTPVAMFSPGAAKALGDLTRDLEGMKPEACAGLKAGRYTGCMIEILAILQAVSHADYVVNCYLFGNMCSNSDRDSKNANREEDDDFKDFRRYALFFAQLADAVNTSDRNQVNALLKSVTIPPVSFGIKREPHATRVLVTAYVGGGWSWQTASPHQQVWGLVAPVGVEISQARDSGNSLSLLLSPLDFAYPLTLKLKNTDATIKGSDVVVPSAYVFYGWKNYPVAAGLGYSRGRSIENPDQRVGRILIVVAFDMPLFRLH